MKLCVHGILVGVQSVDGLMAILFYCYMVNRQYNNKTIQQYNHSIAYFNRCCTPAYNNSLNSSGVMAILLEKPVRTSVKVVSLYTRTTFNV